MLLLNVLVRILVVFQLNDTVHVLQPPKSRDWENPCLSNKYLCYGIRVKLHWLGPKLIKHNKVYCSNKNTGHWLFHLLSQPWNLIFKCFLKILGFFLGFLISFSEITQKIRCSTLLPLFITGPITHGQGCSLFVYVERHTQLNPR